MLSEKITLWLAQGGNVGNSIPNFIREEVAQLEQQVEMLEEALGQIVEWSKAYPIDVFPEPDFKKAARVLKDGGMTLDAISASNMRHVVEGVGEIAKEALAGEESKASVGR